MIEDGDGRCVSQLGLGLEGRARQGPEGRHSGEAPFRGQPPVHSLLPCVPACRLAAGPSLPGVPSEQFLCTGCVPRTVLFRVSLPLKHSVFYEAGSHVSLPSQTRLALLAASPHLRAPLP